jgi:hypothetical protein
MHAGRIGRAIQRILRPTIWAKGAIPPAERKYASPLKRVILPLFSLTLVWSGLLAIKYGIPSLETLLPDAQSDAIGWAFALAALVSFIGGVLPRLWGAEMAGYVSLGCLLFVYFLGLRILGANDDGVRGFLSGIVFSALFLLLFRLWILGIEIRDRRG